MITTLDQALEQNKMLVEETFRMTTLYNNACDVIEHLKQNGSAASSSVNAKIMRELEMLKNQNTEMEKALTSKNELITELTRASRNYAKESDALKKKVAELEQQKLFTPNDGSEVSLLKTELNEKNLQLAAITEQFLITTKTSRDAQLEVQKLNRERLVLFDHIKKYGT